MMKSKLFIFLIFLTYYAYSQNPNWQVNVNSYQFSMTFTTFLTVNGQTLTSSQDRVAAFVNGELRGVSEVVYIPSANKYVAFLTVFANTSGETISFKIYDSSQDNVVDVMRTETFVIDANVGGIFQSYSLAKPALSKEANLSSFGFQGVTAVSTMITSDEVNIVLPSTSSLTNVIPVFSTSSGSKVYINTTVQSSGSSSQDFTNDIVYSVISEDESTVTQYTVSATLEQSPNILTAVLSSTASSNLNRTLVPLKIEFSSPVLDFKSDHFTVSNAVIINLSQETSTIYTADIVPISEGLLSVGIDANSVKDNNGSLNLQSNKLDFSYDITRPIVTNTSVMESGNNFYFDVTFSEEVMNVDVSDFELTGIAKSGYIISSIVSNSTTNFSININKTNDIKGNVGLQLKETSNITDTNNNPVVRVVSESYFNEGVTLSSDNFEMQKEVLTYPNPVENKLYVNLKNISVKSYEVYSPAGKKVINATSFKNEIILNNLTSGIYLLKFHLSDNTFLTRKIIKK